jgi:hypothetical protein
MGTESRDNLLYELLITCLSLVSCALFFTPLAKYAPLVLFPLGLFSIIKFRVIRKTIKPFFILILIGVVLSVYSTGNHTYFFLKDLLFFIQVPLVIAVGYMIARRKNSSSFFLTKFMSFSVAILLIHLSLIFINWNDFIENPMVFHKNYGTNALNVIVLIVVLKNLPIGGLWFSKGKTKSFLSFLILLYVLLSFSRTTISIYILVLFYGIVGWNVRRTIFLVIILVPLLFQYVNSESSVVLREGDVTFLSKVKNSVSELQLKDFQSQKEITHFWRGYEGFLGLNKYLQGRPMQLALGQGFGTTVSVPRDSFSDWSGEDLEGLKTISVFHVGFVTILLKTGVIGLSLYLWFLYRPFLERRIKDVSVEMMHPLIIYILITTFLTHGLFKADINPMILILIGMSYGIKNISA